MHLKSLARGTLLALSTIAMGSMAAYHGSDQDQLVEGGILRVDNTGNVYVGKYSQEPASNSEQIEDAIELQPFYGYHQPAEKHVQHEKSETPKQLGHLKQPETPEQHEQLEQSPTAEQQKPLEQPEMPTVHGPPEHPVQLEQPQQPVKDVLVIEQVNTRPYNEHSTSLSSVIVNTEELAPLEHWGKCGLHNGWKCIEGQCCSQAGWCGVGAAFCSVPNNCQSFYGRCVNQTFPAGANTWEDQRKHVGIEGSLHCTRPGTIALTFDDGPTEHVTHELLDLLKKENAKASFFVSGISAGKGQLDTTPARLHMVRRMFEEGHYIGSHGFSHARYNELSTLGRKNDLVRNEVMIRNLISAYPTYMRLPYGECNDQCFADIHGLGYHIVAGGHDSGDWHPDITLEKAKKAFDTMFQTIGPSDNVIISQHDSTKLSAVDLTRHILKEAKKKHLKAVNFPQCRNEKTRDGYRFHNKADESRLGKPAKDIPRAVRNAIDQASLTGAAAGTTITQSWLVIGMAGLIMLM